MQTIEKYIRKAMQTRTWYCLERIQRAILILTRRLPLIKSPVLKSILYRIFLEIEMFTTRGKALFYGIIISMHNTLDRLHELLVNRLQAIGNRFILP